MFRETVIIFFAIKGSDFLCPYSKMYKKQLRTPINRDLIKVCGRSEVKIKNVVSSTKTNDKL